jgi:hypothetical protein
MQETSSTVTEQKLLPLDAQRVITFKDRGFPYTLYLGRIMPADWERYYEGIVHTQRNNGKMIEEVLDLDSPGIDMVEQKLEKVEGYSGDFASRPGWQSKIPPRHTRPASWLLRTCSVSEQLRDRTFDPDSFEVCLDAAWGMTTPGEMTMYYGLVHRFTALSADHKRKFYRSSSMTKVVGGSRNGMTILPVRYKVLVGIYDELIQSVEGYSVNGAPLESVDAIRREMDLYHKVQAAEELFVGTQISE